MLISKEAYRDTSETKVSRTAEAVRKALPNSAGDDVTIVEKEATYHIVPKKFLGKEKFTKVMQVVKNLHGEYMSREKPATGGCQRQKGWNHEKTSSMRV